MNLSKILNLTFFLAALPSVSSSMSLSISEALERGNQANFEILIQNESLIEEEQALKISRSYLYPNLSLNFSQSRAMTPNVGSITDSLSEIPERRFIDRFDAVIRARMSLLNFEAIDRARQQTRSFESRRYDIDDAIQRLLERIAQTYLQHWRNQKRLELIEATIERSETLLEIAKTRKEAGVSTPLDVTRAEVDLLENELARLQQETRALESEMTLKRVLALPLQKSIAVETVQLDPIQPSVSVDSAELEQVLSARADYQAALSSLEEAELELSSAKRQRLPSLNLDGQWGYASQTASNDQKEQWRVGIGLNVPLFEGFRVDAEVEQASSNLRQSENRLASIREEIEAELRIVLHEIHSRERERSVAARNVELNRQEFELAKLRFEEGVADNSDVVDAQVGLAAAEDTAIEAEYRYLLSRFKYARVTGDVWQAIR